MRPFDDATRRNIGKACASFTRLPDGERPPALKRAAVALALTAAGEGEESALLLTLRASSLRAHRGQWALRAGDATRTKRRSRRRCASSTRNSG
jgi:hypothetical protein